jgi:hypothetical protein
MRKAEVSRKSSKELEEADQLILNVTTSFGHEFRIAGCMLSMLNVIIEAYKRSVGSGAVLINSLAITAHQQTRNYLQSKRILASPR